MKADQNPFATRRLERVLAFDPKLIGESWEGLHARWQSLGRSAFVVGPHGSGKTTFLDGFAEQLEAPVTRFFFNEQACFLTHFDRKRMQGAAGTVWLVDGDLHLPRSERRELMGASSLSSGLLVARHRVWRGPVLLRLKATAGLARELLRRAAPEHLERLQPQLPSRLARTSGNLRELWMDCYDELTG